MQRHTVYYQGRVQGVGFRYTTRRVAAQYAVTGTVENLADGRVRLIAEGVSGEVNRFLDQVEASMSGYIEAKQVEMSSATGEFDRFDIRLS